MNNQPRKHHYVPQFYLGGFTDNGTADGYLSILDKNRSKEWRSKPKDVAHQRDFHEIDAGPGGDPMAIEKHLGQFESKWSAILREIIEARQLPDDDDRFGDFLMFIAFMTARVPRIRSQVQRFITEVRKKEEFARDSCGQQKHDLEKVVENRGDAFDQTWHVQQMVEMAATLGPLLSLRSWQLWIADESSPDLICSDSPVSLNWTLPVSSPYPPGFELKNTVVSVPLQKRIAVVGVFETVRDSRNMTKHEVAQINSATGKYAQQLYCPDPDFIWIAKDGTLGGRAELLKMLESSTENN